MIEIKHRDVAYKAVVYSKSLNRYFVSDTLRVDTGLACLFGFENKLEAQFDDLILCSEKFVKEIKEDWWMRDWVHIGNIESTGLKDKNGVEIYEGDIVNAWSEGSQATLEVKWGVGTAGFFLFRKHGCIIWKLSGGGKDYTQETIEVIGNIYENPELLGE